MPAFPDFPEDSTALGSQPDAAQIEYMRVALAGAGPIPTAVLYNNGKALNAAIRAATGSAGTTGGGGGGWNEPLMLMGG